MSVYKKIIFIAAAAALAVNMRAYYDLVQSEDKLAALDDSIDVEIMVRNAFDTRIIDNPEIINRIAAGQSQDVRVNEGGTLFVARISPVLGEPGCVQIDSFSFSEKTELASDDDKLFDYLIAGEASGEEPDPSRRYCDVNAESTQPSIAPRSLRPTPALKI